MGKKVILFFPRVNFTNVWIPLSVFSLVPSIKSEGFEPVIIDESIEKKSYNLLLKHLDNSVCVGVSCQIGSQVRGAIKVSKFIKTKNPKLPIIWGGYFPTLEPDTVLSAPYVDAVVIGQGQLTFKEILKALNRGHNLKGIMGVNFKENGLIVRNKRRSIVHLDSLPNVQYDKDTRKYLRHTVASKTMMYNSSEGCPYGCTFCSPSRFFNAKWSAQKADKVIEGIRDIQLQTGANGIYFCDSNFFADVERVQLICQGLIKEKLDIKWRAYGRVDQFVNFKPSFIELLKKSGFSELIVGAESGAQRILNSTKKGILTKEIFDLADLCYKQGIFIRFLFMVGFPGIPEQVKKEVNATFDTTRKLMNNYPNHDIHWNCYKPLSPQEMSFAQKYGFKKPSVIEDWIDFGDYSLVNHNPWINKEVKTFLSPLLRFYIHVAEPLRTKLFYSNKEPNVIERIANRMARWRINNNFFLIPLEYWISERLRTFCKRSTYSLDHL